MFYVHEKLNIKLKRRTYLKDILKQLTEKNICLQQIDKTWTGKVHIGTLHVLHSLQNKSVIGVIKSRIIMRGIINMHGLRN